MVKRVVDPLVRFQLDPLNWSNAMIVPICDCVTWQVLCAQNFDSPFKYEFLFIIYFLLCCHHWSVNFSQRNPNFVLSAIVLIWIHLQNGSHFLYNFESDMGEKKSALFHFRKLIVLDYLKLSCNNQFSIYISASLIWATFCYIGKSHNSVTIILLYWWFFLFLIL